MLAIHKEHGYVVQVLSLQGKSISFKGECNGKYGKFLKDDFKFEGTMPKYIHQIITINQKGKGKYEVKLKRKITKEEREIFINILKEVDYE